MRDDSNTFINIYYAIHKSTDLHAFTSTLKVGNAHEAILVLHKGSDDHLPSVDSSARLPCLGHEKEEIYISKTCILMF